MRQKRDCLSSENTAKKRKMIPGLEDEAFWKGSDLWIIKGNYSINIVVHSYLGGNFKNMEARGKARTDQDIALSQ